MRWTALPLLLSLLGSDGVSAEAPIPHDLDSTPPLVLARIEAAVDRVNQEPASALAWAELAKVYDAHGIDLAAECYGQALELDDQIAEWWHLMAIQQAAAGKIEMALTANQRAIDLDGSYVPSYWRRGLWLLEWNDAAAAESAFRSALERAPGDLDAASGLARALLAMDRVEEAERVLTDLLRRKPGYRYGHHLLGVTYRRLGRMEAARVELSMSVGSRPPFEDPWAEQVREQRTGLANAISGASRAIAEGRVAEVISELEALSSRYPEDVVLANKLSEAYLAAGRLEQAKAVLVGSLEIDPSYYASHLHMAQVQDRMGESEEALASFGRAIELAPGIWQSHYEKGKVLHRLRRFDEAAAALEEAMRHGAHQEANAFLLLGEAYFREGEWSQAAETFGHAGERFPHLAGAFSGRAAALGELGRLDEAKEAFARAVRINPRHPTLRGVAMRLREIESEGATGAASSDPSEGDTP